MADDENAAPDSESSICPYCRETIHPQATRCKHCHTWLTSEEERAGGFETTRGPWTVTDMGPAMKAPLCHLLRRAAGIVIRKAASGAGLGDWWLVAA